MSDVDASLLEALENLMGKSSPATPKEEPVERDEDFNRRLERAERLVNGLEE
ncbi:MAG: hypothetical protein IKG18_08120 [Atopobiaceae bacterium]|nr:hypothetical protein [Atopobiaceae bacterium]